VDQTTLTGIFPRDRLRRTEGADAKSALVTLGVADRHVIAGRTAKAFAARTPPQLKPAVAAAL